MSNKTLSIISYITIIGWIIAYVKFNDQNPKSNLVKYHLKQSLGIAIISIVISIALMVIVGIVPSLNFLGYIQYAVLVFWILGIINAANEAFKPVPVVGRMFEEKFAFIK